MVFKQVFLLFVLSMVFVSSQHGESIETLIIKDGYSVEAHFVVTSDGYILQMHHILQTSSHNNHNNNHNNQDRKVVLLMHDLLCSSADFVTSGPDYALPYYLVDNNCDVWLGNTRGNSYSRQHLTLDPEPYNSTFWAFDWNEMGIYDLPAMIDYILKVTGKQQLYYVGHSQGATAFFVMASKLPHYNKKISGMSALSPVAFLSHVPFMVLRQESEYLLDNPVLDSEVVNIEFIPDYTFDSYLGQDLCLNITSPEEQGICYNIYMLISGYSTTYIDASRVNVILNYNPSTASANSFLHYGQCVLTGDFGEFGPGNSTGPAYDLSKITTKISLFYSNNDALVSKKDVYKLKHYLTNAHVNFYEIKNDQFTHSDFLYATNAKDLVYGNVWYEIRHS